MITSKLTIAKEHFEMAVQCYKLERYFSALHLAGAVDEILGRQLDRMNHGHSFGQSSGMQQAVDNMAAEYEYQGLRMPDDQQLRSELNSPKNQSKHFSNPNESHTNFNCQAAAFDMLRRAYHNYACVFGSSSADDAVRAYLVVQAQRRGA